MKIVSVHVQAFGKLNGVKMDLHDGINATKNVNGYGKTTMASFIRAMFFGFTYKTSGGVKDSSRFAPWQGTGRFGGSMVVEHEGQTYRIERFFGATQKQETLTVTNDKTGKALDLQGMEVGEYFLGLTAESYDRSAYFPQEAVELSSNDNFDSRLANLIENGADDYDKIQDRLRAYKKNYRYERGSGGKIYELDCRKRALLQKQFEAERAERRASEIERSLADVEKEKQALLKRQEQYQRRQEQLQREVAQTQPTPEQQRASTRLAELNETISRVPAEFDKDVARCDNLANAIANYKEDKIERKYNKLALIVACVVMLAGLVLLILGATNVISVAFVYADVVVVVACAGGIVALILNGRKSARGVTDVKGKKSELISEYINVAQKYVYVDGKDFETVKRDLWQAHVNYQGDVRERDALQNIVRAPQSGSAKAENELNEVNNALSNTVEQLNALAVQFGRLTEERKNLTFDSVEIMDELLTVDGERKQAEFEYEVADTVSQLLAQAKDNLSSSYLPKLTARCSELLSQITDAPYSVVVDRSFNVKIREQGLTKDMSEFSRGIREITLLCFRVALSELLYDGAIPFIIIDDAFVNFDENNFVRATKLLKKLSAHAQVVYLTCHNRTGGLLK